MHKKIDLAYAVGIAGGYIVKAIDPSNRPPNLAADGTLSIVDFETDGSLKIGYAYPLTAVIDPQGYVKADKEWDAMVASGRPNHGYDGNGVLTFSSRPFTQDELNQAWNKTARKTSLDNLTEANFNAAMLQSRTRQRAALLASLQNPEVVPTTVSDKVP